MSYPQHLHNIWNGVLADDTVPAHNVVMEGMARAFRAGGSIMLEHASAAEEGILEGVKVMDLMGRGADARELARVGHNLQSAIRQITE